MVTINKKEGTLSDLDKATPMDIEKIKKSMRVDSEFELVQIYAIYDIKGEKYDVPFFAHSDLFAQRRFTLMSKEEGTILNEYLKDFNLVSLGNFNLITGEVFVKNEIILEGKQIIKTKKQEVT